MAPNSTTLTQVAGHIGVNLKTPDIMFVQEIQDSSGPTDDGTVDANLTMQTMASAIKAASGVQYSFIDINPINDQDGGEPGGNIRQVYLYAFIYDLLFVCTEMCFKLQSAEGEARGSVSGRRLDPVNICHH